jgi:predicted Fe-S protein YdhL (DUF1289 family)
MSFRDLFGVDAHVGEVPSPCVQICIIEPSDGLCVGCARTLDEIATWGSMSNEARRALMQRLPSRRNQPDGVS